MSTIAGLLEAGQQLWVSCTYPACFNQNHKIDLPSLAKRLGEQHGAMHNDLVRLYVCTECRKAGRDRRPVMFTLIPNYGKVAGRLNNWSEPPSG